MRIRIESFGQLSGITGKYFETDVADTDQLAAVLPDTYPALRNSKYLIAVNRKVITGNTPLSPTDSIALLPPYSGG